jgi:hypothetical protein
MVVMSFMFLSSKHIDINSIPIIERSILDVDGRQLVPGQQLLDKPILKRENYGTFRVTI